MATRRIQSRVSGKVNSFSGSGTANSRRRDPCGRIDYMKPRFYCTFAATWSGNRSDPRWQPRPHSRCGAYCCTDMLRALVTQTAEDETMLRRIQYGVLTVGLIRSDSAASAGGITARQVARVDRARRGLSEESAKQGQRKLARAPQPARRTHGSLHAGAHQLRRRLERPGRSEALAYLESLGLPKRTYSARCKPWSSAPRSRKNARC